MKTSQRHRHPHPARQLRRYLAAASVLLAATLPAHAGQLYRFTNADGGLELSSSVPNARVPFGYDVIDSRSGRLLRKVDPQLTAAEAAAKAERERRIGVCAIAQRRVQTMYESDADINDAESKALQSLETRIVNAQANLTHLRNQRSKLEDQAARLERNGTGVTPVLVGNLDRANNQIDNLDLEIEHRRQEMADTRAGYEQDRAIFALGDCEVAASSPLFDLKPSTPAKGNDDQVVGNR
ncbi:MAG: hypothetical protein AB8B93_00785 [Pseudomonadales bacterium]